MEDLESLSCDQLVQKLLALVEADQDDSLDEVLDWFLFTYSPEHSFSTVADNSEVLRDPVLLATIVNKVKDVYEPEIFLETLNIVSCIEGNEEAIAATGVVRLILQMMLKDMKNARTQQLACKILGNLASQPSVRHFIGKMKGISRIVDTMRNHQTNHLVISDACKALTNLSCGNRYNKAIMVNEGLIEFLITTMGLIDGLPNISNVLNDCLMLLRNLVFAETSADSDFEVDRSRCLQNALTYMKTFGNHAGIQTNSIWIFIGFISGRPKNKEVLHSFGVLKLVLLAMENHPDDDLVQMAACTCIGILAKNAVIRKQIEIFGGSVKLFQVLENQRHDVDTLRAAMKALYRLSFSGSLRSLLAEDGPVAVGYIVDAMNYHKSDAPFHRISILTLLQFSKDDILKGVVENDALPCIFHVYKKWKDIPQFAHVFRLAQSALQLFFGKQTTIYETKGEAAYQVPRLKEELERLREKEIKKVEPVLAVDAITDSPPGGKKKKKPIKRIPTALPRNRLPKIPGLEEAATAGGGATPQITVEEKNAGMTNPPTPRPPKQKSLQKSEKSKSAKSKTEKLDIGDGVDNLNPVKSPRESRSPRKDGPKDEKTEKVANGLEGSEGKSPRVKKDSARKGSVRPVVEEEKAVLPKAKGEPTKKEPKKKGLEVTRAVRKNSIALARIQQDKINTPEVVLKADVERLNKELAEANKRIAEMKELADDIEVQTTIKDSLIKTLQKERQTAHDSAIMDGFFKRNKQKMSRLKQQNETLRTENNKLRKELEERPDEIPKKVDSSTETKKSDKKGSKKDK